MNRRALWLGLVGMAAVCSVTAYSRAEERVGWRTDGTGRYPQANPTVQWSPDSNILWKTKLPNKTHSSPILVGDKIFTMSEPTDLVCLRADTGEILWQAATTYVDLFGEEKAAQIATDVAQGEMLKKEAGQLRQELNQLEKTPGTPPEKIAAANARLESLNAQVEKLLTHPAPLRAPSGNTASTPASDGKLVYAVLGNGLVTAFTPEGKRQWITFVQRGALTYGHSASPLLTGGKLIVHFDDLVALDPQTGKEQWRAEVEVRYGSPVTTKVDDVDVVVTASGAVVRASDGKVLAKEIFKLGDSSPMVYDGVIYVMESGKIRAIRLKASGDEVAAEDLWEGRGAQDRRFASLLYDGGLLYGVTSTGILEAVDADNGEFVYRKRLDLGKGTMYPSPTLAGRLVFVACDNGTTIVLEPSREYTEVARNELEAFSSTPIFVGSRMYVRGKQHMYCIGQ